MAKQSSVYELYRELLIEHGRMRLLAPRLRSAIMTDLSRLEAVVTVPPSFTADLVAFVIRACRADLERLQRHGPAGAPDDLVCESCADRDVPWPCVEVRSLAEVYGIEVT